MWNIWSLNKISYKRNISTHIKLCFSHSSNPLEGWAKKSTFPHDLPFALQSRLNKPGLENDKSGEEIFASCPCDKLPWARIRRKTHLLKTSCKMSYSFEKEIIQQILLTAIDKYFVKHRNRRAFITRSKNLFGFWKTPEKYLAFEALF